MLPQAHNKLGNLTAMDANRIGYWKHTTITQILIVYGYTNRINPVLRNLIFKF